MAAVGVRPSTPMTTLARRSRSASAATCRSASCSCGFRRSTPSTSSAIPARRSPSRAARSRLRVRRRHRGTGRRPRSRRRRHARPAAEGRLQDRSCARRAVHAHARSCAARPAGREMPEALRELLEAIYGAATAPRSCRSVSCSCARRSRSSLAARSRAAPRGALARVGPPDLLARLARTVPLGVVLARTGDRIAITAITVTKFAQP